MGCTGGRFQATAGQARAVVCAGEGLARGAALAPASGKGVISPRRIMDDWGQQSCRVCLAKVPVVRDTNMVTGAEGVSGEGRCVRGRQ